jgi:hypothetical protein
MSPFTHCGNLLRFFRSFSAPADFIQLSQYYIAYIVPTLKNLHNSREYEKNNRNNGSGRVGMAVALYLRPVEDEK